MPRDRDLDKQFERELGEQIRRNVYDSILSRVSPERAAEKPDGIVAITFTDIVDSSSFVAKLGDRAAVSCSGPTTRSFAQWFGTTGARRWSGPATGS